MAYWRPSSYVYVVSPSSTVAPLTCRQRFPASITEPEPAHSPGIEGYGSRQQRSDCAVATIGIQHHIMSRAILFINNLPALRRNSRIRLSPSFTLGWSEAVLESR